MGELSNHFLKMEQSQHSVFIFLLGEDNSELRAIILKVLFYHPIFQ